MDVASSEFRTKDDMYDLDFKVRTKEWMAQLPRHPVLCLLARPLAMANVM